MDSGDLIPAVSAMEPSEAWVGPRRNTPERRLVWRRIRLLLGCLTATASADLLVDRLPADKADLVNGADGWVESQQSPYDTSSCRTQVEDSESQRLDAQRHTWSWLPGPTNLFNGVFKSVSQACRWSRYELEKWILPLLAECFITCNTTKF